MYQTWGGKEDPWGNSLSSTQYWFDHVTDLAGSEDAAGRLLRCPVGVAQKRMRGRSGIGGWAGIDYGMMDVRPPKIAAIEAPNRQAYFLDWVSSAGGIIFPNRFRSIMSNPDKVAEVLRH